MTSLNLIVPSNLSGIIPSSENESIIDSCVCVCVCVCKCVNVSVKMMSGRVRSRVGGVKDCRGGVHVTITA